MGTQFINNKRRYEQLEERLERPMVLLSVAIIPLIVVPLFADLPTYAVRTFDALSWGIWGCFLVEFVVTTRLAPDKLRHLRDRWYELPALAAPFLVLIAGFGGAFLFLLRPLRLARTTRLIRSGRALRLVRATRLASYATRSFAAARWILSKHGLQYALLAGGVLYLMLAGVIVLFERDGGNIRSYPEALWWGVATMTALRNDTDFPVTPEGKFVAVLVALLGLTLVSLLTANIAAFLVHGDRTSHGSADHAVSTADLKAQLDRIEAAIERSQEPKASNHG